MAKDKSIEREITAVLRIEGGTADKGLLDVYDAADTIYGLARATNIVTHAFLNKNQVRNRADGLQGGQVFIHSSLKGCFEEKFEVHFEKHAIKEFGASVLSSIYWDYLTWAWSAAIGRERDADTPYLKKVIDKDPDLSYVIGDALETPMQKLHRAVARDSTMKIALNRPHVGDLITLDHNSLAYVSTREVEAATSYIVGNVTKFNVLSDFGRLYSDAEERIVSFRLATHEERLRSLCLSSMKEIVDGAHGKMNFKVSRVVSAQDVVKRYLVHDILPLSKG